MNSIIVTVDARRYQDEDDCLAAAADTYSVEHPELIGWDLAPQWADDQREAILLTVPRDYYERRMIGEVEALIGDDGTGDLGIIVRQAIQDDPTVTVADIVEIVREARADATRNE